MQIKAPEVYSMIEALGLHFRNNISNRFTRNALSSLVIDNATWNQIEELTEKSDNYRYQGYHLDELYSLILAIAKFVNVARKSAIQNLRFGNTDKLASQDRILRDMVISNFSSNLNILADMINKLYVKVVEIDKSSASGKKPVCEKIPELANIGRYLIE